MENIAMSLEEIRRRASKFERQVRRRNVGEYVATALVAIVLGFYCKVFHDPVPRVGSALSIVGALYAAYQLHRCATLEKPPGGANDDILSVYSRELKRQRDALDGVWRWYLGPLLPGLAIFIVGVAIGLPIRNQYRLLAAAIPLGWVGGAFWVVAVLNKSEARKLQTQIDELQSLKH
ncbi:MAG: hypothetical protein ACLQKA_02435 [Bryobacteraceae bacterium]